MVRHQTNNFDVPKSHAVLHGSFFSQITVRIIDIYEKYGKYSESYSDS